MYSFLRPSPNVVPVSPAPQNCAIQGRVNDNQDEEIKALKSQLKRMLVVMADLSSTTTTTTATTTTTTTTAIAIKSAILTNNTDTQSISTWLRADVPAFKIKPPTFTRCYSMKASGGGGTASGFHEACDGKGPTVVVVKAKDGAVFGGFADKAWGSSAGDAAYVASDTAFLFCLACGGDTAKPKGAHQLKLNGNSNQRAMYNSAAFGPAFGGGHDLHIQSNTSFGSGSNLGNSYTCPAGAYSSTACHNYLAGSHSFTVEDYEVFVVSAA